MKKRTWHYIQKPQEHDISCPECGGVNLAWSEFENHIWCYDCQKDLNNYTSALSGPVPVQVALMLGISFDRYNMETKKVEKFNVENGKYESNENK